MIRTFQKKAGFNSEVTTVKNVLWDDKFNICYIEGFDGSKRVSTNYNLTACLHFVSTGDWVEIKQDGEKCSGCSCEHDDGKVDISEMIDRFFARSPFMVNLDISDKIKPEPIDFSTAQVGDTVHSILHGPVKVLSSDGSGRPIKVKPFAAGEDRWILRDGRLHSSDLTPLIAGWVDTDGNLCRTRPEPKIDWSKVAIDAPVEIKFAIGRPEILHYAGIIGPITGNPMFWTRGRTSQTTTDMSSNENATYKLINTEGK